MLTFMLIATLTSFGSQANDSVKGYSCEDSHCPELVQGENPERLYSYTKDVTGAAGEDNVNSYTITADTKKNDTGRATVLGKNPGSVVKYSDPANPFYVQGRCNCHSLFDNLALKTNLLDYAILMPNLEIEWMFVNRWSAALEYQVAWYAKESPRKVYRIATLMPEVRFWAINRAKWHGMYVGIFGGVGMYDLYKGEKGHEGEGAMGGVSVGYMFPISKHLSLDAGIGVGYLRIRDKEYIPADGHYLYQLTKNINYIGPLRLKLSLVWRLKSNNN